MEAPFFPPNSGKRLSRMILLVLILAPLAGLAMAEDTGTLIISSYPLGAEIYLDDKYIGNATRNIILENISIGIHYVEWRLDHYNGCSKIIGVDQGGIAATHCDLVPRLGNIRVESNPPGAYVILDGTSVKGKTNMVVTGILEGAHSVTLRLPGYYDCVLPVPVQEMVTVPVQCNLEEIPTTGTINAASTPPGADVYLDRISLGISNLKIPRIEPGRHTLSFIKYGYYDWSTTVDVVAAKIYDIHALLIPKNGTISLTSNPPGAEIIIDGLDIGKTPYHGEFFQGTHDVLFYAPDGYRNFTKTIVVPYGEANLAATLECGAPDAIAQAETDINENAMYGPGTARGLLQDARDLLAQNRCVDAFHAAANASVWARDIDDDGVPNYRDIWKSIPNIFIYFSPFLVVLSGLIAIAWYREISQLAPEITVEELPLTEDQERTIRVKTRLKKMPEFFYCAVLLDGKVIDQLDAPGTKDIPLGRLEQGTYTIQVDLDAYRSKLWRNHAEESREVVVPIGYNSALENEKSGPIKQIRPDIISKILT